PEYVAIQAAPSAAAGKSDPLPFRKVSIRIVQGRGEPLKGEAARRLEAEGLARWLDEEVLGRERIVDEEGMARSVQPRDVAILFRKLIDVHHYLEPLRRRGLRYVVEGERHFYAVQEVIDAVNLLRAIDNPHDRLALVGLLRSPLGGLADAEIYELHRRRLLDYRAGRRIQEAGSPYPAIKELYTILAGLHRDIRILPVGEAISRIFDRLPVRLLAARSFHGEQALANLEKLRQQAEVLGREGWSTLREVVTRLEARVLEVKEEAESALAEENIEAIRILSIHKSKGLEFPVVVLAGCHAAINQNGERGPAVLQDWSTRLAGIRTESCWSLPALYIAEKARLREEEEQKRTLYVAMTRAREHLALSCAATDRKSGGSVIAMLDQAVGKETTATEEGLIAAGSGTIEIRRVQEGLSPPARPPAVIRDEPAPTDWRSYAALWRERSRACEAALETEIFLTPTLLKRREAEEAERFFEKRKETAFADLSMMTGELAHRFLEDWDLDEDP
ncbi:MAG TPA: 3'-5' exonuclease, partial [Vicinamibacteria bacterium]